MRDHSPDRPKVPLVPVSIKFETDTPKHGWWMIFGKIQEENYKDSKVVPWAKDSNEGRFIYEFSIRCSVVCDPITSLHDFIYRQASDLDGYGKWEVDQEGSECTIESWSLGDLEQIRIDLPVNDYGNGFLNLLMNKVDFLSALEKVYCDFGRKGGWHLYGLLDS